MKITYGDPNELEIEEGSFTNIEAIDIPEGKCLFRLFVNKPKDAKIVLNDIEQDSVLVDEMDVVHWNVTCDGYKPSVGEFQVINSIGFTISLLPERKKKKRIKNPYIKWSLNNKYGYQVDIIDLSDQEDCDLPLPSPEGYDNTYLYAFGGNVYWKEIKLENLLTPKASDSGKYLTFDSTKGFSFNSPIPVLPEDETGVFILKNENGNLYWAKDNALPDFPVEQLGNKQYYMLTYKDGKMKWTLNPFTLPKLPDETYFNGDKFVLSYRNDETFWSDGTVYWKDIKGTIADQPEISEDLNKALQDAKDMSEKANNNATDALAKADKALAWEDSFGVEAPGFVFIDGKIKNEDGFYYPDGRDIAQLHTDFDIFKNRYSTFEKYVIAQVQMRMTSPDYSQLSNVEYVMGNFFYNSKKRYLHIESFEVGSTIEVFKPLYNEDSGSVQGPDLSSGPIMTIYKNVSGVGDIRMLELTTGFFYKVSNKKSFELKYVGELPYGEYPG